MLSYGLCYDIMLLSRLATNDMYRGIRWTVPLLLGDKSCLLCGKQRPFSVIYTRMSDVRQPIFLYRHEKRRGVSIITTLVIWAASSFLCSHSSLSSLRGVRTAADRRGSRRAAVWWRPSHPRQRPEGGPLRRGRDADAGDHRISYGSHSPRVLFSPSFRVPISSSWFHWFHLC